MLKRSVSISFWQPELPKPPTATPIFQSALLKLLACRRVLFFLCCFFYYSVERGGGAEGKWRVFLFLFNFVFFCFALFCCILCRCIDLKFVILLCLLSFSSRFNFASYLRFFFFFSLVLDMFLLALLVEGNAFETFRCLSFGWLGLENFIKFVMTVFSLVLFVLFRFFVKTQNIEMKKCTKM